jgi:UDP-glucuronate decarboxylase
MARSYTLRKRVMVTGGAGFLGSHLIDRLLEKGYDVLCVDNLFTGTKDNIAHHHNNAHFEFMRHDITLPLFVEVDEIYNLACPASPVHYQHDPVQTTKTSVIGTVNMLGSASLSD